MEYNLAAQAFLNLDVRTYSEMSYRNAHGLQKRN